MTPETAMFVPRDVQLWSVDRFDTTGEYEFKAVFALRGQDEPRIDMVLHDPEEHWMLFMAYSASGPELVYSAHIHRQLTKALMDKADARIVLMREDAVVKDFRVQLKRIREASEKDHLN